MNKLQLVQTWLRESRSDWSSRVGFQLVEEVDAEFILSLRLNQQLNAHISATEVDKGEQQVWVQNYKERERRGEEFYFLIQHKTANVGTVRLYDFQGDSFCWGSWLIQPGTAPTVALRSMQLVYELGFDVLQFQSSHFDVRQANKSVWRFHERTGARLVKETELNRYYSLLASDYKLSQRKNYR